MSSPSPVSAAAARLFPLGDAAVVVEFGHEISPDTHRAIQALSAYLMQHPFVGLREYVPAFTTLTVYYDPWLVSDNGRQQPYERVAELLQQMLPAAQAAQAETEGLCVEIPVCYGGEFGPDLEAVAAHTGLAPDEVIARHAGPDYLVHMIGFAPGFPYLGGLDVALATPRKSQPRALVPAGAVGIAGPQTGIYSLPTPGGWQLIGRTPVRLFNPAWPQPSLLQAGQRVRFVPISATEFEKLSRRKVARTLASLTFGCSSRPRAIVGVVLARELQPKVSEAKVRATMSLSILRPGLLTTVQDLGRHGYQKDGILVSGTMDAVALRMANLLVGNAEYVAGLEITLLGPKIRFDADHLIALAGANLSPTLNGQPVGMHRPIAVRAGTELAFGAPVAGSRVYLAVAGGFALAPVLGSQSTYLRAGLGGFQGRALQAGDTIECAGPTPAALRLLPALAPAEAAWQQVSWTPNLAWLHGAAASPVIRAIRGPEYERFSAESQRAFWQHPYVVSTEADRMGYRLQGPVLERLTAAELLSTAVTFGTVQVPAGGQPIALMADHQTTGGYPRIAQVITADFSALAQARPGQRIQFQEVSLAEAQALYLAQERHLRALQRAIEFKLTTY